MRATARVPSSRRTLPSSKKRSHTAAPRAPPRWGNRSVQSGHAKAKRRRPDFSATAPGSIPSSRRHRLGVIAALVREIPGPLNMLAGPGSPSLAELARLGVQRVSVGSGPARAAMGLTRRIGRELLRSGTYSSLGGDALPYAEANALFEDHSRSEPPGEI